MGRWMGGAEGGSPARRTLFLSPSSDKRGPCSFSSPPPHPRPPFNSNLLPFVTEPRLCFLACGGVLCVLFIKAVCCVPSTVSLLCTLRLVCHCSFVEELSRWFHIIPSLHIDLDLVARRHLSVQRSTAHRVPKFIRPARVQ